MSTIKNHNGCTQYIAKLVIAKLSQTQVDKSETMTFYQVHLLKYTKNSINKRKLARRATHANLLHCKKKSEKTAVKKRQSTVSYGTVFRPFKIGLPLLGTVISEKTGSLNLTVYFTIQGTVKKRDRLRDPSIRRYLHVLGCRKKTGQITESLNSLLFACFRVPLNNGLHNGIPQFTVICMFQGTVKKRARQRVPSNHRYITVSVYR